MRDALGNLNRGRSQLGTPVPAAPASFFFVFFYVVRSPIYIHSFLVGSGRTRCRLYMIGKFIVAWHKVPTPKGLKVSPGKRHSYLVEKLSLALVMSQLGGIGVAKN